MVFVTPPPASGAAINPHEEDAVSANPTGTPPRPADVVRSDAFEHIEQLLDGGPEAESVSRSGRWKVSEPSPASNSPGNPSAVPRKKSQPRNEVVDHDSPAAESAEVDPVGPEGIGEEWIPESVGLARRYAAIAGGVLAGTVLAVGVTAWILTRPGPSDTAARPTANMAQDVDSHVTENAAVESDITHSSGPGELEVDEVPSPSEGAAEDLPLVEEVPTEDEKSESPELLSAEEESDPGNADQPDTNQETLPPDPDSVSDPEPEPSIPPASPDPPPMVGDDGLASFARWLSTATADPIQPTVTDGRPSTDGLVADVPQAAVQPSRPTPPPVDVEKRLEDAVAAIEFRQVALIDALRTLSDLSTIPITVDPQALGRRMISPRRPVNLLRTDATIAELLQELLDPLELGYVATEGHLLVTTKTESLGDPVTIEHEVADLTEGRSEATVELGRWLTQMIRPSTWQIHGGIGSYRADQTALVVEQSDTVQFQILVFCEKLRVARGLPRRSRIPDAMLRSQPLSQQMATLQQPLTLRVWQEENLNQIAARIEGERPVTVLVNWQALLMSGWSPEDRMRFFCQEQPLEQALHSLLDPLGLTFRVVDPAVMEITSPEAAAAENDVEFYSLPAELQSAEEVQKLSGRIADRVGLARFQPTGTGALAYDLASQTLIVSLPQILQREVQELLAAP